MASYVVVPAKAGTHNHRKQFGEGSLLVLLLPRSIDLAARVRAFARTTAEFEAAKVPHPATSAFVHRRHFSLKFSRPL